MSETSSRRDRDLDYVREQSAKDFFYFARTVLGYVDSKLEWDEIPDDPTLAADRRNWKTKQVTQEGPEYGLSDLGPHRQMADLLMSPSRRKHMEAPRGSFKTTITLAWILWMLLTKDRNLRILYAMDTKTEALKKVDAVKEMLEESELIKQVWPDATIKKSRSGMFTIGGRTKLGIVDPTMEAGGVDADITGSHRDIIVLDDPVNFQNVKTKEGLERTKTYFDAVQRLLDPGGILVAVGTRYLDADLWGQIISDMSYEVGGPFECLVLDCGMELEEDENKHWTLIGEPIFPHLTKPVLMTHLRGSAGGHVEFAAQYLNRILAGSHQVFHRHQFKLERWDPEWMTRLRFHVLTDLAFGGDCYSVMWVVGLDGADNAYAVDCQVGRWPPQEHPIRICDVWEKWVGKGCSIAQICLEKTALNKSVRSGLDAEIRMRQIRCKVTDVPRGSTDPSKDQRINGLASRFEQGRFCMCDTVPRYYNDGMSTKVLFDPVGHTIEGVKLPAGELVDQFIRFPRGKFKDIPDALADLDQYHHDGRRVCQGAGKKADLKAMMAGRAGRRLAGPAPRQNPTQGSKWDALHERTVQRWG